VIQFELESLMIQKKMTEEGLHYWQKKFNVADERIKELER
jgi:hypothetical protein